MIDEYSDDLTGLDDHLNKHPQFSAQNAAAPAQTRRRTPPVMYSDDFEEPVRSRAPRNQAAPAIEPRRGYRREMYTRDNAAQDLEEEALGSILKEQGSEMGFVRILGLAIFCLIIISGSFYLSFTLGKKIFLTPMAKQELPQDNIPFSTQTSSQELSEIENVTAKPNSNEELTEYERIQKSLKEKKVIYQNPQSKAVAKPVPTPAVKSIPAPVKVAQAKPKPAAAVQPKAVIPSSPENTIYRVIAGAYTDSLYAKQISERLKVQGFQAVIYRNEDNMYRVQLGAYSNRQNAQNMLDRAIAQGYQAYLSLN
jgi:cell division septation protein DedD